MNHIIEVLQHNQYNSNYKLIVSFCHLKENTMN